MYICVRIAFCHSLIIDFLSIIHYLSENYAQDLVRALTTELCVRPYARPYARHYNGTLCETLRKTLQRNFA